MDFVCESIRLRPKLVEWSGIGLLNELDCVRMNLKILSMAQVAPAANKKNKTN